MWTYIHTDELYHHGIKGQKWGVRRFQRADGTRTAAGKKRAQTAEERREHRKEVVKNVAKKAAVGIAVGAAAGVGYAFLKKAKADPSKSIKKDMRAAVKARHRLSDAELASRIKRLEAEKKLKDLTDESVSKGRTTIGKILTNSGTSAATTILTGGILYGTKAALTKKVDAKDAADYLAPKPKKK